MKLIDLWSAWRPNSMPYVLDADNEILANDRSREATVVFENWQAAYQDRGFCAPGDTRLHLGLLPIPFVGDLRRASVYVLLLNPGLGPHDYFGEHEVPRYREALLRNLHQQVSGGEFPFLFLNPEFSWHGGFQWWHGKLTGIIDSLSKKRGLSFAEARQWLAGKIACIELLPYHSASFRNTDRWLQRLPSAQVARDFVQTDVLPRVRKGEACAVVTRQIQAWGLKEEERIVCYSGGEARAAHLTPKSRGGGLLLEHLLGESS